MKKRAYFYPTGIVSPRAFIKPEETKSFVANQTVEIDRVQPGVLIYAYSLGQAIDILFLVSQGISDMQPFKVENVKEL